MIRSVQALAVILLLSAVTQFTVVADVFAEDAAPSIATHERWVTSLAHSPDGSIIATAGGQSLQYRPGDVLLWEAATGNLIAALEGHTSNVWSVAFSPDGQTLVTSGYDGKVIVWSVAEKKSTATLEKHKGWCRSVAFHPGGKQFATAVPEVVMHTAGRPVARA